MPGTLPKLLVPPGHGFRSFADVGQGSGSGVEGFSSVKNVAFLSTLEIEDKKLGLKNLGETNTTLLKNGGFYII